MLFNKKKQYSIQMFYKIIFCKFWTRQIKAIETIKLLIIIENIKIKINKMSLDYYYSVLSKCILIITIMHHQCTLLLLFQGQALVNGFNIGRYWPGEGPQVTLFVPKPLMTRSPNKNILVIFELEGMNCEGKVCKMVFIDHFYIKNKPKNDQLSTNNDGYDFPHHKYD